MIKKIVTVTLCAVILSTATVTAASFSDISGHWAEESITRLSDAGIVNGVTEDLFMPEDEVTRAQYLKMIMEAIGLTPDDSGNHQCLDAGLYDWYAPYLKKALMCGIIPQEMIAGYKEEVSYELDESGKATVSNITYSGAFNGNLPVTREEMAVLTQYIYQYTRTILTNKPVSTDGVKPFADNDKISSWAIVSVKQAVANGFIQGMDNNMFNPKNTATRAQAATIILRVSDKIEE